MKIIFIFVALAVLLAGLAAVQLKAANGKGRVGAYRRHKFMTDNEQEFFGLFVVALPDHYIFPQVAMSALLDTASNDKRTAHGDRLRIAQQRVDYVICTRHCEVVAVVERDDKTHLRAKDELRDARLEQAGIRTVHVQARDKPKVEAIRTMILGPMVTEADKATTENAGQGTVFASATPFTQQ